MFGVWDKDRAQPRADLLRALIVGAGLAGRTLARDLREAPEYGLAPIGFLDDDRTKRAVGGLPVVGPLSRLADAVPRYDVRVVLIAIPGLPPAALRRVADAATAAGAAVRVL